MRPQPPVGARAAYGTRLVFRIPPDDLIPFSTAGILAAITRLEPVVHKLAVPGSIPVRAEGSGGGAYLIPLPGGLVGALGGITFVVRKGRANELRAFGAPAVSDALGTIKFDAAATRRTRRLLRDRFAILDSSVAAPDALQAPLEVTLGRDRLAVDSIFGKAGLVAHRTRAPRPRRKLSYRPGDLETAIEAPYRLILSPSTEGRWAHALEPVRPSKDVDHVELWHTRLGEVKAAPDGGEVVDERNPGRRIVRAVWARDRDRLPASVWQDATSPLPAHSNTDPFRMSLDPADRHMIVRQTAETLIGDHGRPIEPTPLAADALWLSGLGAWLRLHGNWNTRPYSDAEIRSILALNYVAPLGRDQHVEVLYPGYLYPFGHRTAFVKITDRKMKAASPSLAALYQRKILVISEPLRTYPDQLHLPFTQVEIRPLITPPLDDPGAAQDKFFWPTINGASFLFEIRALDREARQQSFPMALLWVPEHNPNFGMIDDTYANDDRRAVQTFGQQIAFAQARTSGDTTLPTSTIRFLGKAGAGGSQPRMSSADVVIPAVQQLSPTAPIPIAYHPKYKSKGFTGADNSAELWASVLVAGEVTPEHAKDPVVALPQLRFGPGGAGSDRSGGFVAPSMPIRGISRVVGAVGSVDDKMAKMTYDPKTFFAGSSPKLFGLIDLSDMTVSVDSDLLKIPKLVSEVVSRVEALIDDVGRAAGDLAQAIAEAQRRMADSVGKPADWVAKAQAALDAANDAQGEFTGVPEKLTQALDMIRGEGKSDAAKLFMDNLRAQVESSAKRFEDLADKLPLYIGNVLRSVAKVLRTAVGDSITLVEDMYRYVNGLAESGVLLRIRFEWRPHLKSWPSETSPLLKVKEDSLVFSITAQAGMNGRNEIYALAQLSDFSLHLFPEAELIRLVFDRFSFKAGTGKPELDVVLRDIEFHGVLSFVESLKDLIPLDGFSDPPDISVTADGLSAGFTLGLPDIAFGMFSITNLSLGADIQVPFFGKAISYGLSFCSRERPFTIAVIILGGGGWCSIRLSADGLDVLEVGLEAGACIAVNFGVASGSVSAMLGIYIRLEGRGGSITGYFRLRGEVDVLGLVSAAIELYMALSYHPDCGKLIGEASVTVNVSVIGFSKSVHIHTQRVFAGANGDPTFAEVMLLDDGTSPAWTDYCQAFAEE
ncbi:hypothetical protein IAG41_22505 [Sphingomonas sp. JC676]|uniref:hypothetical protein n=1 Tax=Sphingomonas sp. JC676 TaxID=2768065 RepID=UPI0016578618|nr:hypothetical protein [Sphingomonas sp. JC676]MBC9035171.1 hypothetical protein [Sphingomonas sp. JC676]